VVAKTHLWNREYYSDDILERNLGEVDGVQQALAGELWDRGTTGRTVSFNAHWARIRIRAKFGQLPRAIRRSPPKSWGSPARDKASAWANTLLKG